MSEPVALLQAPAAPAGPFRFLHYFEEGDPAFAGRDREIREVVAGILRARTLVLYGRSGLGKTSLLLAGVFPALRERGLRPVYLRVFDEPLADLATALDEAAAAGAAAARPEPVVLVLDQLEELFIRFRDAPEVRARFIDSLSRRLAGGELDLRVVFSLREDYLAELDDFRPRLPDLFANEYRLHPLSAFGARQAISRALKLHGIEYEQRLLTGLVDELAKDGYDPSILQILGSELDRETAPVRPLRALSAEDLKLLGGVDGIFQRHWATLRDHLRRQHSPELRLLVLVILESLVTAEWTKRAVTVDSLCQGYFRTTPAEVGQALAILLAHRLVRPLLRGTTPRYELIHDRLVEHVERWLKEDLLFMGLRNARDRVAAVARDEGFRQQPDLLLTGGQLKNVVEIHKERLTFSEIELEVLLRSAVYQRSPDLVAYWAERYGTARSPELILDLLRHPDAPIRQGAAEAVGHLGEGTARLSAQCLELALEDPDGQVRRAAGRSLAHRLGPREQDELSQKLRSHRTRGAALEVLADFLEQDRLPSSFLWIWRLWARSLVRERKLARHRDLIHRRGQLGAIAGAIAGGVYLFGLAVWPLLWMMWRDGLGILKEQRQLSLGASLGVALSLGAFIGWRVAVASAKQAVVAREGRWGRSVLTSVSHAFGPALLAGSILFFSTLALHDLRDAKFLWLAMPVVVHGLVALQLALTRLCLRPTASKAKSWAWILASALGVSSLVPLLFSPLPVHGKPDMARIYLWAFGGIAWSASFFVAAVTLLHTGRKSPLLLGPMPEPSPRRRALARLLVLVCLVASVFLNQELYKFQELPLVKRIKPLISALWRKELPPVRK